MKKKFNQGDRCEIQLSQEMADQLNLIEELGFTPETCKIVSFTFESKEYDSLTKLLGNRTLVNKNIERKGELLLKNGFKSTNPVIINTNGQIIDGQHRSLAAKQLDIPFKFTIDVNTALEDSLQTTIELNNSGKPWTTTDYVKAYAENGNVQYQKFLDLVEELQYNLNRSLILYYGSTPSHDTRKSIAEGKFKFEEKKANYARDKRNQLATLAELVNQRYKKLVESESFIRAYLEVSKKDNFSYAILKAQFEKMRYTELDRKDLRDSLITVYNVQRRTNRINL